MIYFDENQVYISNIGLFDLGLSYKGEPTNIRCVDNGVSFDCDMHPTWEENAPVDLKAHFTLTQEPSGLFALQTSFSEHPDNGVVDMQGKTLMFKDGDDFVLGDVPANLGSRVTLASLFKALAPYVFKKEMLSTVQYFKDPSKLEGEEIVIPDDRSHLLCYRDNEFEQYMDCKYWNTSDGNVLLVGIFNVGLKPEFQQVRFYKFDLHNGTMRQLPTAFSAEWPVNEDDGNRGIIYSIDDEGDDIVAHLPKQPGQDIQVKILTFNGQTFN